MRIASSPTIANVATAKYMITANDPATAARRVIEANHASSMSGNRIVYRKTMKPTTNSRRAMKIARKALSTSDADTKR